mgnify:CR=1 FL=1
MENIKQHIAFRLFTLLLVASLFAPTASKFVHIFEHHQHILCINDHSTHIHKVDLDCEFYKFQLNTHFLLPDENNSAFHISHYYQIPTVTYNFLNNHRQLSFSLRGPPVLV